ncbi:MAG: four-carbon acid sugar kinase family protein [Bryobacterales bacterium]|nr:four-carbon acid sugar kinase family protein [Bryobacterales bacterium]
MNKARGVLVADDLTGACDAAAVFARAGWKVAVCLEGVPEDADLLAWSTDSREDDPETAAEKVRVACRQLGAAEAPLLFKKVDSVMRGNVAVEVAAMLRESGRGRAVMCSAFPEQGRIVKDGYVEAAGARIPVPEVASVERLDAANRTELNEIARRSLDREPWPLLVGSSGLAGAVAHLLQQPRRATPKVHRQGQPVLCVGSLHPVTLAQLDWLGAQPRRDYRLVRIEAECPDIEAPGGLFLCGGDTALMVCRKLGVRAIELAGEVAPGIPIGRLVGGVADGHAVITKSGGFGDVAILGRVVDVLSGGAWCELP